MRKYQQKQILELIQTLFEVNDEIKRLFSHSEFPAATQLLADSQEFVLQVGTYIEEIEGEGTRTVELLEELHEDLYHASVELGEESPTNAFIKRLRKQIIEIETCVKTELKPNKIEVVFLPYKASMWDSLESVWLAAKDDPQCDAYVVPIPYYDKKPNGALGQMHYEGGDYPDYVPVVNWQEYDVEARHPDMIFVHNPYDEGNQVTSVHLDFYCKRLKDFTDCLVYIPYFVVADDVPEHFCVLPGTMYAHMVIVQSEKVRDTYIRVFKEYEKANNCKNRFGKPENKFHALGSPKFDKVLNTKREDCILPEQWRKLVEAPDGTSKKVILYNTSVVKILQGNEQYLIKLRSVLETFRSRDDVVLWWRPHPLSESTYESMRPGLLEEYRKIVEEYKNAGFGIYDDTPDLHRAIACTDAYYGDGSSVIALFRSAEKPQMIADFTIHNNMCQKSLKPEFNFICESETAYWAVAASFCGLYKISKNSMICEMVDVIPWIPPFGQRVFGNVLHLDNCLYLTPYNFNALVKYDIQLGKFEKIEIPGVVNNDAIWNSLFWTSALIGNKIILVPCRHDTLLVYDTSKREWASYAEPVSLLRKSQGENKLDRYFLYCIIVGKNLYMPSADSNSIVVFNLNTNVSKLIRFANSGIRLINICYDGQYIWAVDRSAVLYCVDVEKDEIVGTFSGISESLGITEEKLKNCHVASTNTGIMLFFRYLRKVYLFNKQTCCFSELAIFANEKSEHYVSDYYVFPNKLGDKILINSFEEGLVIEHDFESNTLRKSVVEISQQDADMLIGKFVENKELLNELYDFSLVNWIDLLANCPSINHIDNSLGNCGVQIFDYVKRGDVSK